MAEINLEPGSWEALEAKYGQVWDTDQMIDDFEAIGFLANHRNLSWAARPILLS